MNQELARRLCLCVLLLCGGALSARAGDDPPGVVYDRPVTTAVPAHCVPERIVTQKTEFTPGYGLSGYTTVNCCGDCVRVVTTPSFYRPPSLSQTTTVTYACPSALTIIQ